MMLSAELKHTHTLISALVILGWMGWVGPDDGLRYFMLFYFMTDFLFFWQHLKTDMIVHHVVSLLMIGFYWDHENSRQLILTEVSTPFLVLFRLHVLENISKLLFILTFFYFRIYHLGLLLMERRYEVEDPAVWLLFVMFCLNLWWAEIIIRKVVPLPLKTMLCHLTPYSHFLILYNISPTHPPIFNGCMVASSVASYLWHQHKTLWHYLMDLFWFHGISVGISLLNVSSSIKYMSLLFHVADVLFYYFSHQFWILLSIGYDVLLVFLCSKQDFLWLLGWLIIALLLRKQTFGHDGGTQTVIHLIINSFLIPSIMSDRKATPTHHNE